MKARHCSTSARCSSGVSQPRSHSAPGATVLAVRVVRVSNGSDIEVQGGLKTALYIYSRTTAAMTADQRGSGSWRRMRRARTSVVAVRLRGV